MPLCGTRNERYLFICVENVFSSHGGKHHSKGEPWTPVTLQDQTLALILYGLWSVVRSYWMIPSMCHHLFAAWLLLIYVLSMCTRLKTTNVFSLNKNIMVTVACLPCKPSFFHNAARMTLWGSAFISWCITNVVGSRFLPWMNVYG